MIYDHNNIFARILRNEIPYEKIYKDSHILVFHDIKPQALIHALAVPTNHYRDSFEFFNKATDAEILGYMRGINYAVTALGLIESGFRLVANTGKNWGQEVFHFHTHIMGGQALNIP